MNVVISIGNSDNKLTQLQWSDYVSEVEDLIYKSYCRIHFFAGSETYKPWQNVLWLLEFNEVYLPMLEAELKVIRERYNQDSVAIMIGKVKLI